MRIHIGETFKSDQSYEMADFGAFSGEGSLRRKSRFNIAPDRKPREQARILEYQSPLGARAGDPVVGVIGSLW